MPLNNEYKRYFIILQEDDKGYEMAGGKIPTGYVKIEIKNGKGKLTAYAQNIKSGDKVDYRMLLIAPVKKAAVDMGRLMVDGNGRGELNVDFDADNVMRSGMEITDFMVAAVSTNTATPLSGYTGRDKVQWKNSYHIVNKPQDRIDKKQHKLEEVTAPVQTKPMEKPVEAEAPLAPLEAPTEVEEFVVEENEVKPVPMMPIKEEFPVEEHKPKKEHMHIEEIKPEKVPMPMEEVKPKKEHMPVEEIKPEKVPKHIEEVAPIPEEVILPEIKPIPMEEIIQEQPAPIEEKPIEMLPQKPLFEAQTEIKAKFIIETETLHEHIEKPKYECEHIEKPKHECEHIEKSKHECEMHCPEINYKDFYYDEECESDSDSDSDSDDGGKKKHEKHEAKEKEKDHEECFEEGSYFDSPMYRRLEKVLGRLREYEPFEDEDSREKWFKVEDDIYLMNSATIPFAGAWMPLGYPYMSNDCVMMIGRKDYIIGVQYDRSKKDKKYIKTIMFGIPGMKNRYEERYYSMRGYVHFKPHKSRKYGYWIMKVDLGSGEIMMK